MAAREEMAAPARLGPALTAWLPPALAGFAVVVQGFAPWPLAALVLGLVLPLGALAWRAPAAGYTAAFTPIGGALAAAAAWLVLAALLSPLPATAAVGQYQQLVLPLAYLLAYTSGFAAWQWSHLRRAAALFAGLLSLAAVLEPLVTALPSYSGFFVQRNSLSGYMLLLLGMLLPGLTGRRRVATVAAVAIFLAVFCIAFSTSRAALGALVVGAVALALGSTAPVREQVLKPALALALWAVLAANLAGTGAVFSAVGTLPGVSRQLVAQVVGPATADGTEGAPAAALAAPLTAFTASKLASANERWLIWRGTLALLAETPWHGHGPGTFHVVYPRFSLPGDRSARHYAHNDPLQIAVELGMPGVLLTLALVGAVASTWRRGRRRSDGVGRRLESDALVAGLAAVAAHSVFDYDGYVPATLVLAGFVLARLDVLAADHAPLPAARPVRGRRRPLVGALLLCVLAVPVNQLLGAALRGERYEAAIAALGRGALDEARRALDQAELLAPHERIAVARAHLYLAAFSASPDPARRALYRAQIEQQLAEAVRMNPHLPEVPYTRMLLALAEPALPAAIRASRLERAFDEVMALDRRFFPARLELARTLLAAHAPAAARDVLEEGLADAFPVHPLVREYFDLLRALRAADGDLRGARRAARLLERIDALLGTA